MRLSFVRLCTAFICMIASLSSHAKPLVLSSIKPLTLIAQEITGNYADLDTLLPASASHHDYPLKVSDHARLQKADVLLWVGPELESFLQRSVANLPRSKVITTYDLAGISWPAEPDSAVNDDHHHNAKDPHLWLDPRNAIVVAQALTEKLAQIDAANAQRYRANLSQFVGKMQQLDKNLGVSLAPVSKVGFAVYHEGFAHFVGHYGLRQLDYVAFTPEQKPGAKHLQQLRERLSKDGECLFLEPYNNMQSTRDLAQELHLRVGTLDALGSQGVVTYTQLLEQMAAGFSTCLANGRH